MSDSTGHSSSDSFDLNSCLAELRESQFPEGTFPLKPRVEMANGCVSILASSQSDPIATIHFGFSASSAPVSVESVCLAGLVVNVLNRLSERLDSERNSPSLPRVPISVDTVPTLDPVVPDATAINTEAVGFATPASVESPGSPDPRRRDA